MKKTAKTKRKEPFSLYLLASGKPGKPITEKEFLKITEQDKPFKTSKVSYRLKDGYIYQGSSQEEIKVIKRLESKDAFVKLRGQCIAIPYRFGGKDHVYYPDFIVLTKTGKVVIIEVKQIAQMTSKQNQKKYAALGRYCKSRGYLYLMCDKKLRPYDKIKESPIKGKVEKEIDRILDEKGCFVYKDYQAMIQGKTRKEVNHIRDRIGRYVANHLGEVKQVGDLTYDIKRFRIKLIYRAEPIKLDLTQFM